MQHLKMFDLSLLYNLLSVSTDTHRTLAAFVLHEKSSCLDFLSLHLLGACFSSTSQCSEIRFQSLDQSKITINISTRTSDPQPPAIMCRRLVVPSFSHSNTTLPATFIASELFSYTNTKNKKSTVIEIKHFYSSASVTMITIS